LEFQEHGFTPEESKELCEILDQTNFDFVELSGGTYEFQEEWFPFLRRLPLVLEGTGFICSARQLNKVKVGIKINSVEFQEHGFTPEESKELCEILDQTNFDFVEPGPFQTLCKILQSHSCGCAWEQEWWGLRIPGRMRTWIYPRGVKGTVWDPRPDQLWLCWVVWRNIWSRAKTNAINCFQSLDHSRRCAKSSSHIAAGALESRRFTPEESKELCEILDQTNFDFVELSGGTYEAGAFPTLLGE
jgi:hypothetical protein